MSILLRVAMVTEEDGGHAAGEGEGAGSCSWPQQEERPGTHRSTDWAHYHRAHHLNSTSIGRSKHV